MTIRAYAFDAYGTLFDVHAAMARHRAAMGAEADAFSALWRVKQLEYTWTRTLMGRYADFWQLTAEALDYCFARFPSVPAALRQPLLDAYHELGAFADVHPALARLKGQGTRMVIFTNGTRTMAGAAARSAGIDGLIEGIASVEDVGRFKTVPEVYALPGRMLGLALGEVALVSSNRWDVAGATAAGMPAIWLNRAGLPEEYPDLCPVKIITTLAEL
ncbi:MAG: haloacid dehalogenase type II [Proteobacteria bacterium]|nr:haloacid dehalogenase type II [Pseudomonadota bacterium]